MSTASHLEALADAAALVRSVVKDDPEGRKAILSCGDHEAIALELAGALARILRTSAKGCQDCILSVLDDWQSDIRASLTTTEE